MFGHDWLCVGRASTIPEPGDWFTVTLLGEPLIVVRDKGGAVRVLSAVCQHRGMQVVEGCGHATTLRCPYHHWTYGLDGRLLGAPAMERTEGFAKGDFGLPALAVEEWQGFVFCNFDAAAPPLGPTLARIEPHVANWHLAEAVATPTFTLHDLPWNWKVMFENFNDGYHANRLHEVIQDFCPSDLARFPEPWDDASNVVFRHNGFVHVDGGFNATHKALLPIFPDLTEEDRWRATFALLPPTLCLGLAPDQAFYFLVRPLAAGRIDVEIGYLFAPESMRHPMFDHLLAASDAGVQVFVRQDQDATTKVQRGLALALRHPGAVLLAGGDPRRVQPVAGPALPPRLARARRRVARDVDRLPPTTALADVLQLRGLNGWLAPPLVPVAVSPVGVSGPAVTVALGLGSGPGGVGLAPLHDLLSDDLGGGVVVVAGAGGVAGAVWGEILSVAAAASGAVAVLVDGRGRCGGRGRRRDPLVGLGPGDRRARRGGPRGRRRDPGRHRCGDHGARPADRR